MLNEQWSAHFESHRAYLEVIAESLIEPKLRRKVDAQDVVQDTFMAAHIGIESAPKSGDTDEIQRWLITILKNRLIDIRRKYYGHKRDLQLENSVDAALDHSIQGIAAMVAAVQTSPSGAAIRQEQLARLANAIRLLEKGQREVIVERYINQSNLAAICEALGKTDKSVAGLLYRGMINLRALLALSQEPSREEKFLDFKKLCEGAPKDIR